MNIQDWPMDRIMQLPDFCFGRRWLMSLIATSGIGAANWDITELALPEVCVIWEFAVWTPETPALLNAVRLALGDVLPTTIAQMDALEPLFPGYGIQGAGPRRINLPFYSVNHFSKLRQPVSASGRRIILEVSPGAALTFTAGTEVVVSSVPKEVPDWLISR